jgi:hypothetical protein
VKCKGRFRLNTVLIDDEEMYLRVVAINSFKKVPFIFDRGLSLGDFPVPLSLFRDDVNTEF